MVGHVDRHFEIAARVDRLFRGGQVDAEPAGAQPAQDVQRLGNDE